MKLIAVQDANLNVPRFRRGLIFLKDEL